MNVAATGSSRRGQRIRRALWWSLGMILAGLAAWALLKVLNQEEQYRPGDSVEGITRELDRNAGAAGSGFAFTDVTREAGLSDFVSFAGNRTSQLPEDMGGGVAWGDFDNDGDDDLFVVSAGGPLGAPEKALAPSLLYENLGGGKFRQYDAFPDLRIRGMGAAWADYDNDGWLDLAVTGYDTIRLFHNKQGHGFEPVAKAIPSLPGFWTGVSWGDFNRDGWQDLYICGYVKYRFESKDASRRSEQFGQAVPHTLNPSSYEPERNLLFQNDGKGGFREVARALGVDNSTGRSLSGLWHDFDNNGWLDLYVANDISESKLYLNRDGRFEDAGRTAWVGEYRGSMGLAAGDFDRDGDDDLFITHWVAQQFALYESLLAQQGLVDKKPAELHFTDVAELKGIGQPTLRSIGWGAEFADLDSDGWPDLAVAAGSTFESEASPKRLIGMPSFLFRNQKGEGFQNITTSTLPTQTPHVSRGLAVSDFDNDGDLDIAIVDLDGGVRLLRNDTRQGHAIRLRLRAPADGAQVTAWTGNTPLRRTISSASYLSQSTRLVHIGLGDATRVDRLVVRWPGAAREETFGPVDATRNVIWEIQPGQPPKAPMDDKQRQIAFWDKQRAGMDKWKRDRDPQAAAALFKEALALDPKHEDARYYLASSLAALGDSAGAIAELKTLLTINPASHRGLQRLALLRAQTAKTRADLETAAMEAQRAHDLNPEETGALLLRAEIELLQGNNTAAQGHLDRVIRSNQRSALAHFLLAYMTPSAAAKKAHLDATAKARGPEWKPRGSVLEGDTKQLMHDETSLLGAYADAWDSKSDPQPQFAALARRLQQFR